jgi:multiple antibiotic resistance protein
MAGDLTTFALTTFTAIFAIVNPMGATTFFVVLARDYAPDLKRRVIQKAVLSATIVLVVFAFAGTYIFALFGTTLPAFEIAGGILLFRIGLTMMQGERPRTQLTAQDREEALQREVVGVVPLGIPMFAGPGAITTVMVFMAGTSTSQGIDFLQTGIIIVCIVVTMFAGWIMLTNADRIFNRIGRMGVYAFSRIMGIIIAAVAVQFVLNGITAWTPSLMSVLPGP